ncbi:MAG: TlpA family protein disulfide reductase [Atopobiaceae bacterium]|nr:TlpA family protein disulfide reductase [Atopobiaceae bacterium]
MKINTVGKTLAIALTAALLAGCGGSSDTADVADASEVIEEESVEAIEAAEDEVSEGSYLDVADDEGVLTMPGFTFTLPEELKDIDLNIAGLDLVSADISQISLYLYDPNEDIMTQPQEPSFLWFIGVPLEEELDDFLLKSFRDTTSENVTVDMLKEHFREVGSNNMFRYYYFDQPQVLPLLTGEDGDRDAELKEAGIDQERIDQAAELAAAADELIGGFKPDDINFEKQQTADDINTSALANLTLQNMDGTSIKLGDVFAQNKLTMIDVWATTCGACVESMPALEELSKQYADKGFAVIGVCNDVVEGNGEVDEDTLADAKDIVSSTGVTYTNVLSDSKFRELIDVVGTPTIVYVDSKGNVVYGPQHGSYSKKVTAGIIEENLTKVQ